MAISENSYIFWLHQKWLSDLNEPALISQLALFVTSSSSGPRVWATPTHDPRITGDSPSRSCVREMTSSCANISALSTVPLGRLFYRGAQMNGLHSTPNAHKLGPCGQGMHQLQCIFNPSMRQVLYVKKLCCLGADFPPLFGTWSGIIFAKLLTPILRVSLSMIRSLGDYAIRLSKEEEVH